jgi:hypothetical protein
MHNPFAILAITIRFGHAYEISAFAPVDDRHHCPIQQYRACKLRLGSFDRPCGFSPIAALDAKRNGSG